MTIIQRAAGRRPCLTFRSCLLCDLAGCFKIMFEVFDCVMEVRTVLLQEFMDLHASFETE